MKYRKNIVILLLSVIALMLFYSHEGRSQCKNATTFETFHPNKIRTIVSPSGGIFHKTGGYGYLVPFSGVEAPSTLYSGGLWIAGYNEDGDLCVSAEQEHNLYRYDFIPGPILHPGTPPGEEDCRLWDQVWKVSRRQIKAHIEDFQDGLIDKPQAAIFSWPGARNTFFQQYNGFSLPANRENLAPFADFNQNQLYEPDKGEYPAIPDISWSIIPEQMTWCVFNDLSYGYAHEYKQPLSVEVQLTIYGFACQDNDLLNRTSFFHYEIINASSSDYNDVKVGMYLNHQLGCADDNYIGSWPEGNAAFIYNADSLDGNNGDQCEGYYGLLPGYGAYPPVQSAIFLDQPMHSMMYFFVSSFFDFPTGSFGPTEDYQYYNILSGIWRDGNVLSSAGSGYNLPPAEVTTFAFSGNPLDSSSWAVKNLEMWPILDTRLVPATHIGQFKKDSSFTLTMAYITHYQDDNDYLQNISLMYEEIPLVKNLYPTGFEDQCQAFEDCSFDCVWAGDANIDGVANEKDMIEVALHAGMLGPGRNSPVRWEPFAGPEWQKTGTESQDLKHVDCSGSGRIDAEDIGTIEQYFGSTHDFGQDLLTSRVGDHLIMEIDPDVGEGTPIVNPWDKRKITVYLNGLEYDSIYSLAMRILIPKKFTDDVRITETPPFDIGESGFSTHFTYEDQEIFYYSRTDGQNVAITASPFIDIFLEFQNNFLNLSGIDTQTIRITNITAVLKDGTKLLFGSRNLDLYCTELPLGEKNTSKKEIWVYPNPVKETIHLLGLSPGMYKYDFLGLNGNILQSGVLSENKINISSDLAPGIYFLRILNNDKLFVSKIFIH